jgi:hypothetical protein
VKLDLTTAVALAALVMTGFGGLTVSVRTRDPVPSALVAEIVTEEAPTVVGIPLITPVTVFTESPTGSPSALKLVGLFVAAIV